MSVLSVCLHPVLQRTCELERLQENRVNRCLSLRIDASGKGVNVTRVLSQLGKEVVHLTPLGGAFKDFFLRLVEKDGLHLDWVDSESEIRICYTVISRSKHTATEIVEEAPPVGPATDALIRGRFVQLLTCADTLILSGSKAAGFNQDIFPWMVQQAKAQGRNVILDVRGPDLLQSLPHQPDLIKPNFREFLATFFPGRQAVAEERWRRKMEELQEQGIGVILTQGPGPVFYTSAAGICRKEVGPLTAVNAIGSGDAFTAGLASVWCETRDLEAAVAKAVWCGQQNALQLKPGSLY